MRTIPGVEGIHLLCLCRLKTLLLRRWKKCLSFVDAEFCNKRFLILKSELFDFYNVSYCTRKKG